MKDDDRGLVVDDDVVESKGRVSVLYVVVSSSE